MITDDLRHPLVLAPMAGGPSTPELAAGVSEAGGLGFLAAGYLTAEQLEHLIEHTKALTSKPLGVNVFVPGDTLPDQRAIAEYAALLQPVSDEFGVALGDRQHDDDDWEAKIDLLCSIDVDVVSFTFGCPANAVIDRLHAADTEAWVTVTTPAEAVAARAAGADVIVVQGIEAGGHQAVFQDDQDDRTERFTLATLLQLVLDEVDLPVVAAGGIMTGRALAAVLVAGAAAGQLGTAFLLCPEANTAAFHRHAVASPRPTGLTRAFSGRTARGVRNEFMDRFTTAAPSAYPEINHLTAPMRRAARQSGRGDVVSLWAGQAHSLARDCPAAELVGELVAEMRTALDSHTFSRSG